MDNSISRTSCVPILECYNPKIIRIVVSRFLLKKFDLFLLIK